MLEIIDWQKWFKNTLKSRFDKQILLKSGIFFFSFRWYQSFVLEGFYILQLQGSFKKKMKNDFSFYRQCFSISKIFPWDVIFFVPFSPLQNAVIVALSSKSWDVETATELLLSNWGIESCWYNQACPFLRSINICYF